jgi:hypothetical protein
MRLPALGVLAAAFVSTALAAETKFSSGPERVALIELFTSEGCSSCPPAEKWLGDLRSDAGLWRRFVPVAFHVNYWDRLGWRDALATPEFTAREYAYAAAWHAASVYTPCFVRNGAEWQPAAAAAKPATETAGELTLDYDSAGTAHVSYAPAANAAIANLDITVALLGGGIVSAVRAGENSGRELHHEFVALHLMHAALVRGEGGKFFARLSLPPLDRASSRTPHHAIAAWVSPRGRLAPLQAVGGWLPDK